MLLKKTRKLLLRSKDNRLGGLWSMALADQVKSHLLAVGGIWTKRIRRMKRAISDFTQAVHDFVMLSEKGRLSWYTLFKMASRNLISSISRTSVTVAAIASGTAAIVFLVGFAYGLQGIVTDRLIQPNSLRLADVQSSSTALELNPENLDKMAKMEGVEAVAPAMSLAGSLKFAESKTEVVVLGARNAFLQYSHLEMLAGEQFSPEAEEEYYGEANDIGELVAMMSEGQVAGAMREQAVFYENGEPVSGREVTFRVADDFYVPLRAAPGVDAPIKGYVRGSILDNYSGVEVWGSPYDSVSTVGRSAADSTGRWYGRWLEVQAVPVYEESAPTVYLPKSGDNGAQITEHGYLTQAKIVVLSSQEAEADKLLDKLLIDEGFVLGDSTENGAVQAASDDAEASEGSNSSANSVEMLFGNNTSAGSASNSGTATNSAAARILPEDDAAALRAIVDEELEAKQASESAVSAIVSVPRQGGKEILISSGLLNVWELNPEDVIGKTMTLEFIVSGGLIPGLNGRVISKPIDYRVAGVFKDDDRSMVYTPLSDIESMGVSKYTTAKVLAKEAGILSAVRERVESLGYTTRSIADTLSQVERLFRVMRFLLGSFGMIAFIVALFGMFNTLTVSLLERTREIGVMKTLGTTDGDVMRLMVVEAMLIGVVGGVGGILLGIFGAEVIDLVLGLFREDSVGIGLFQFPLGFLIMVFLLAVVVGMATGMYPATRAKKISALNALRYE